MKLLNRLLPDLVLELVMRLQRRTDYLGKYNRAAYQIVQKEV